MGTQSGLAGNAGSGIPLGLFVIGCENGSDMNCDRVCKERNKITANDLDNAAYELFETTNRIWGNKKAVRQLRGIQDRIHQLASRIRDFE